MRPRRIVLLVVVAVFAVLAAATARWIVWPREDEPGRADAVVVLSGGDERLPAAVRLVERGAAPVLVVSHGPPEVCGAEASYDVVCFLPEPDRTQGEARAASRLARDRGWRSLVVVTSTYHVTRARMLFERCFDGEVRVVGARPDSLAGLPSAENIVREWAGFAHAFVAERGC